jgi:hypothetical protein
LRQTHADPASSSSCAAGTLSARRSSCGRTRGVRRRSIPARRSGSSDSPKRTCGGALALDPTLEEARIRLAHVVGDRGKIDDAVALADEALATSLPPFLEIYAALTGWPRFGRRSNDSRAPGAARGGAAGRCAQRRAAAGLHALIDALRPDEQAAFVTFTERVAIRSLFSSDAPALTALVAAPMPAAETALNDAAHAAMVVGTAATGRPIVILFSDGEDTASFLDDKAVLDTARRTGSVVCAVTTGDKDGVLPELTALTGGTFVKEPSLDKVARRFNEILDSFRRRNLISFTPTGVTGVGWHTLTVRVKGGGDVKARTGYWSSPVGSGR